MPFQFSNITNLLDRLEKYRTRDPPLLPKDLDSESRRVIEYWFRVHRSQLDDRSPSGTDGVKLLSTLFPEKRTDRVYGLQETKLARLIGRALFLSSARVKDLDGWRTPGNGDLGECVGRVLKDFDCEPKPGAAVTVEEVERVLQQLGSRCRFSGPDVRAEMNAEEPVKIVRGVLLRMKSIEAKWFTRLILKDYSPVVLPWTMVLESYHFLLPGLLRFQDTFTAAMELLNGPLKRYPSNPDEKSRRLFKDEAAKLLAPRVGVKVGRPPFWKARSMAHSAQMAEKQMWSIERKYDGEYCEVHIDLSKGVDDCIQIFSKSGKDSTQDRRAAHQTIIDALRIGKPDCAFTDRCIVLGELVVYSDTEEKILEFHKIRKYVSRSESFLGTDGDSQQHDDEHLMLVFFDVLLVDENILMRTGYADRREALSKLIKKRPGYAITSEHKTVDFSKEGALEILRYQFAAALAFRTEGLVMKPLSTPYFSFDAAEDKETKNYFIKLKKDYIQELGEKRDVADFAVIGASFDCQKALRSEIRGLQFTHLHLGCLKNPEDVRFGRMPVFEVVGHLGDEMTIPKSVLQAFNDYVRFHNKPFERSGNRLKQPEGYDLALDTTSASKMSMILTEPCVVEILGSGFDRPGNKSYFMLRHPRILKVHFDRSWRDAVTLHELQVIAAKARAAPVEGESEEMLAWIEHLKGKVERSQERKRAASAETTPQTDTTVSPTSVAQQMREVNVNASPLASLSRRNRNRSSPVPLIRVDTVELLPDRRETTSQEDLPLQPARSLLVNGLPTPVSSAEGKAQSTNGAQASGDTRAAERSSNGKRLLTESELGVSSRNRKRQRTVGPEGEKVVPQFKRCSTCGKVSYKRGPDGKRRPILEASLEQRRPGIRYEGIK